MEYLGRYTHRIAISNNRIKSIGGVTFTYKNRKKDGRIEEMSLKADEFIRRFLLYVLPKKFMKIRYFGFMGHMNKGKYIPLLREYIDPKADLPVKREETTEKMMLRLTGRDINMCTQCQKGQMIVIGELPNLYWNTS